MQPKRGDLVPSVPLHYHPLQPSFPTDALERNTRIPSVSAERGDPLGPSSAHGAFNTSLKGTRAMLRRRGRRAETIVPTVEDAVRDWLGGEFDTPPRNADWFVMDATPVDYAAARAERQNGGPSRRMPPQHQVADVPELPISNGKIGAVLELSRSPAHLSWAVPDAFDRLVVHLVARYYELVSWSEPHKPRYCTTTNPRRGSADGDGPSRALDPHRPPQHCSCQGSTSLARPPHP